MMTMPARTGRLPALGRWRLAGAFLLLFLALGSLARLGLFVFNADAALLRPAALGAALALGAIYDLAIGLWWALPLTLLAWLWPARAARSLGWAATALAALLSIVLVFVHAAEFVFWNEFASRFNFIAVDYLVYTREVLGNIRESYPLAPMLAGVAALAALLTALLARPLRRAAAAPAGGFARRSAGVVAHVALAALATLVVGTGWKERLGQPQLVQLAANGQWEFFHALRYNEIDFERFYATLPRAQAETILRHEFANPAHYRLAASADMPIRREVLPAGPKRALNVVLVSIESFGAEFIESLGGDKGLTPHFERLGREGLFFTQLYATGTRTVRGLEALTLSVPPTPGHAIPMRPNNQNLFTLGSVLASQGWQPLYLYGGYSWFDNMNAFFGGNGYTVIDRSAIAKADVSAENIWGVADEDLFGLALREIDARALRGERVFAHVMTTSNHRPFTYPEGRIDIPSGSGRAGAVKYTDWAIGHFIDEARTKPWFDDTLFVFVADHTSIARGRSDLPMERYHIPMVIYSPKLLAPQRIDTRASQIDVAPTLLGLLNLAYTSEFFGQDVLRDGAGDPHVFMANYQTVGFVDEDLLIELRPKQATRTLAMSQGQAPADEARHALDEGVAFYQVAAQRFSAAALEARAARQP